MIITSSSVGLSSSRAYTRQVSRSISTSMYAGSSTFGASLRRASERSMTTSMSGSATNGAEAVTESGATNGAGAVNCARTATDAESTIPVYNRFGVFDDSDISVSKDLEGDDSPVGKDALIPAYSIGAASTDSESISESYSRIAKRLYLTLLEFLESLSLRGMFQDSLQTTSYGDGSSVNLGRVLNMTDSATPSVWTVSTAYSGTYTEKEYTTFSTTGSVTTADGRSISFGLDMSMSREYMEKHEIEYTASFGAILTDPLVINLGSNPVSVSDQTFCFDIDCDGEDEVISQMNSESGFLAIDKNGDGVINDGSELFGPETGNGFSELAEYDSDGNGWIDEADDIYSKLKVWIKNADGTDSLMTLKEADVGAIYLDNVSTSFDVKDADNNLDARVRTSSVYLHEDGSAGIIQQVDF